MDKIKQFFKEQYIYFLSVFLGILFLSLALLFLKFVYSSFSTTIYYQKAEAEEKPIMKTASWYSREFCLNCRKDLLMANGEALNDNAPNCAADYGKLNSTTTFYYKGEKYECKITDRGAYNGRLDLTSSLFKSLEKLEVGIIEIKIL